MTDVAPSPLRCAEQARRSALDPAGTASQIRSVLLVEHPGPWPADVRERVLLPLVADRMADVRPLVEHEGLRPLLIRRPGRQPSGPPTRRTVLVGGSRPGARWLERLEISDLRELRDLDLAAVARGVGGLGEPVDAAVLVCTHGSKDTCCAVRGRPVARALADTFPEQTWECTHVGGDRWAGNLLLLPSGLMYGHVDPGTAPAMVADVLTGRVPTNGLRGRTALPAPAQAAEIALRRRHGWTGDADVIVRGVAETAGAVEVLADTRVGSLRLRVEMVASEPVEASACAGPLTPVTWTVTSPCPTPGDQESSASRPAPAGGLMGVSGEQLAGLLDWPKID